MISFRGIELQTTKWQSYNGKKLEKYKDLQSYEITKCKIAQYLSCRDEKLLRCKNARVTDHIVTKL